MNLERRRPLVLQNIKADISSRVYIWMVDFIQKYSMRGRHGIIVWKRHIKAKFSSIKRTIFIQALYGAKTFPRAIRVRCTLYPRHRVVLHVPVLLRNPLGSHDDCQLWTYDAQETTMNKRKRKQTRKKNDAPSAPRVVDLSSSSRG